MTDDELRSVARLVDQLMTCLPDNALHPEDETWRWAWEELSDEAQAEVQAAHLAGLAWLKAMQEFPAS